MKLIVKLADKLLEIYENQRNYFNSIVDFLKEYKIHTSYLKGGGNKQSKKSIKLKKSKRSNKSKRSKKSKRSRNYK
jgi:hypothetical protein